MKRFSFKPLALTVVAFMYIGGAAQVVMADDTEIYVPKDIPADQQVRPNILFILDSSGSMTNPVPGTGKSRLKVMHDVVGELIDNLKEANVNIGFMRYGGRSICNGRCSPAANEYGGHVIYPVTHLKNDAIATDMKKTVNKIKAEDWTPLLETYYEAYRYLSGQDTYFSANAYSNRNHKDAVKGREFISPINHSCQKSHIIYITDGEPTQDTDANSLVRSLIGNKNTLHKQDTCGVKGYNGNGACLPHLAEYMANNDMAPKYANRMQTVTSHFIGFALDLKVLEVAAEAGGGLYRSSNNVSGLVDALQSIIVDITADNTTFVAPSVAVTAYNNFGFRDELYYALFRPSEGAHWPGNVKKYKLKTTDADGKPVTPYIIDKNGTRAIDEESGFFKETSVSHWNTIVDGDDVSKGGFAANLKPGHRKIYTWYGDDKTAGNAGNPESLKVLSSSLNSNISNTNITNNMLGTTSGNRNKVLNWIRGYKDDGTARLGIGDILHNEPRLVAYTTDEDIERAESDQTEEKITIFVGTNEGFIHAIDAESGEEQFAFLPKELLAIPNKYRLNQKGYNNKAYGMDGYFTTLTEYSERLANNTRKAEKVNLYAGMRRGGSNYYALDVTKLSEPKLKWVLKGAYKDNYRDLVYQSGGGESYDNIYRITDQNSENSEVTTGFERLGLTYSAAKLGKLKIGSEVRDVLVFTGGYDIKHDILGNNSPRNDELGNALYIVDADTGQLLWRASGTTGRPQSNPSDLKQLVMASMTNSMPASPTLIDINNDGLLDIIYATDLRGQIFRFDIADGNINNIQGHLFAQLGGSNAANNRRFFNSPDVALIRDRGQKPYFTISVGSGFRESPLNEQTDDRFYMIRDTYVTESRSALGNPPVITENDLTDVSGLDSSQANIDAAYGRVAEYQAKIDALEDAVRAAELALEQAKDTSGYTQLYNNYLAKLTTANELQRDIDGIILSTYPPFDANDYTTDAHYNSEYFAQHLAETQAQAELQRGIVLLQDVIRNNLGIENTGEQLQELAGYYTAVVSLQEQLQNSAGKLLEKENLILRGHAKPALTPELQGEIDNLFDVSGLDRDEQGNLDYGDFSDLAYLLNQQINTEYEERKTTEQGTQREALLGLFSGISNEEHLELGNITAALAGIGFGPVEEQQDLEALLAQDQSGILEDLETIAQNFSNSATNMETINTAMENARAEAVNFKADADAKEPGFQSEKNAVEAAYEATRDPQTGIYYWRVKINDEYKSLEQDGDTMSEEQKAHLRNSDGFMLRLPRGEKVLADSISYSGTVLFSTFSPRGQAVSECGSDVGVGRTYGLNMRTAEGVFTTELSGNTVQVRSMVNKQAGIPPTPVILVTPEGTEGGLHDGIYTAPNDSPIEPIYWREQEGRID